MSFLRVNHDVAAFAERTRARARQVPFATSVALNRTAYDCQQAQVAEINLAFDAPTPWIQRGVKYDKSTKQTLRARVYMDEFAGKGVPAYKTLIAQVGGGERRNKRFEQLLRSKGLLPDGYQAMPGDAVELDAYGNVPGAFIVRVLSQLKAFGEQGYMANRRAGSRGAKKLAKLGVSYWVGRPGKGLPLGIWERRAFAHGNAIRPMFIFTRPARYTKRFSFYDLNQATVQRRLPFHLEQAMAEAMRTAR